MVARKRKHFWTEAYRRIFSELGGLICILEYCTVITKHHVYILSIIYTYLVGSFLYKIAISFTFDKKTSLRSLHANPESVFMGRIHFGQKSFSALDWCLFIYFYPVSSFIEHTYYDLL